MPLAWLVDAALLLGLAGLALFIRLPNYQLIPAFTDEVEDMYKGLLITQGRLTPLVDEVSTYNGSLWSWLLAAGFWLTGNSLYVPRTLALSFGVITVLATYPLGRAWGGRLGGLLATALMGTASVHIVVNSHVAWGNCITPLFTTLGVWSLYAAVRAGSDAPQSDNRSPPDPSSSAAGSSNPPALAHSPNPPAPLPGSRNPPAPFPRREGGVAPLPCEGRGVGGLGNRGRGVGGLGNPVTRDGGLGEEKRSVRSGLWLALAGLFWGLAFQTHPSVLALLIGCAMYVIWRAPWMLRSRWLYLAAGLFALMNLNIIVYNLSNGFASLSTGIDRSAYHARNEGMNAWIYLGRLTWLLMGLFQNLAGAVDLRDGNVDYLVEPGLWPSSLIALAAVIWTWRQRNPLPGLLVLSTTLIFPLFNAFFEPILNGRYLEPIVPVLSATVAALLAHESCRIRSLAATPSSELPLRAWLGQGCLALVAIFLVLHPLTSLVAYYQQETKIGRTNARYLQAVESVRGNRRAEDIVVLDRAFQDMVLGKGVGRTVKFFRVAFELDNFSVRVANLSSGELLDPAARCRDQFVILAARKTDLNDDIIATLDLRDLDGQPGKPPAQAAGLGVYRLNGLPPTSTGC